MSQIFNHRTARAKILKAISLGHNSDEALEAWYLPASVYQPAKRHLVKQLGQVLSELETEGVIERELSHGLWIMKERKKESEGESR